MAKRDVTIKEVASVAGVSAGTVSNVINKKSHVNPVIRERVDEVIRRLGYRTNIHARGMIMRRSFNVGIVIPSLSDPFFPRFAESMELDIEERGSNVIITSSRHDAARERQQCELLIAKQVDGLIVTSCASENVDYFNNLVDAGVSIVQLGRYFESIRAPIVRADNRGAGRRALTILHQYGHRNLLHLAGDSESSPDAERDAGFLEQASEMGLLESVASVQASFGAENRAYEVCLETLRERSDVTAVFANNDLTALGCLKACKKLGIAVPDALSVVGVGGFYAPEIMVQTLATFAVDAAEMSRTAVDYLYRSIEARNRNGANGDEGGRSDSGEDVQAAEVAEVPVCFVPGETLTGPGMK